MKNNILAHLFEFAFRVSDQRSTLISCELISSDTTNFAVYKQAGPLFDGGPFCTLFLLHSGCLLHNEKQCMHYLARYRQRLINSYDTKSFGENRHMATCFISHVFRLIDLPMISGLTLSFENDTRGTVSVRLFCILKTSRHFRLL